MPREWLLAVLNVFLDLPWVLRRAAAKSLSAVVAHNPQWSDVIIGGVHTAVERSEFNTRGVLEALQCVATPTHPQKEALAVSVLLLAHHPKIGVLTETAQAVFSSLLLPTSSAHSCS